MILSNQSARVNKVDFNKRTGSLLVHHDEIAGVIGTFSCSFRIISPPDLFEELEAEELAIIPNVSMACWIVGQAFCAL